jgi:hypothetical protein
VQSAGEVAELLAFAVKSVNKRHSELKKKHSELLVDQLWQLTFHPSHQVRCKMAELIKQFAQPLETISTDFVHSQLQVRHCF